MSATTTRLHPPPELSLTPMAKLTRVHVLAAPADRDLANRLVQHLRANNEVRPELFDLKTARSQPDPAGAWYVVLLSGDGGQPQGIPAKKQTPTRLAVTKGLP